MPQCESRDLARRASVAARGIVGSIAFSRTGDLSSGTFEDAQVLKKFGDAPDDLSVL
jgi:hypothetical protein